MKNIIESFLILIGALFLFTAIHDNFILKSGQCHYMFGHRLEVCRIRKEIIKNEWWCEKPGISSNGYCCDPPPECFEVNQ